MTENTNPFARRTTNLKTTDGSSIGTIAEVSAKDDRLDEETKNIEPFIPQQASDSVEEGFQKMVNILNRQRLDDIRDGEQNPGKELHIPPTQNTSTSVQNFSPYTPPQQQFPTVTPEMLSALNSFRPQPETSSPFVTNVNPPVNTDDVQKDTTDKDKEEVEEPKKKEYKMEEILPLLDSIIQYGYASETFNIRGNSITLRTQFYWEENAIRDAIEENVSQNTMRVTAEAMLQQYALASCLVSVGGNYFKPRNIGTPEQLRDSLRERVEFLNTLPSIIVYYINKKRGEFNDKVIYLSEHFDEVLQAF